LFRVSMLSITDAGDSDIIRSMPTEAWRKAGLWKDMTFFMFDCYSHRHVLINLCCMRGVSLW
jgi:hypothetical protein